MVMKYTATFENKVFLTLLALIKIGTQKVGKIAVEINVRQAEFVVYIAASDLFPSPYRAKRKSRPVETPTLVNTATMYFE